MPFCNYRSDLQLEGSEWQKGLHVPNGWPIPQSIWGDFGFNTLG